MILNYASSPFIHWNKTPKKTVYSASTANLNTEKLREQLDHLHKEAQTTRNKANNARSRLLRLSEAAEKFRRQAAVSIQTGKENDARELLFQKKKIMQAMEKSKSRIELLDELAAKLNEAISMREKQLIGNVAFDLDIAIDDDAPSPVRIVSPKDENPDNSDENEDFDQETIKLDDSQELQAPNDNNAERITDYELKNLEASTSGNMSKEADRIGSLKGVSSYEEFLEHIDQQLRDIEVELITFLRFSSLILESKEKLENSKVQQALDVLEGVHQLRGRIASIVQKKADLH
ncbi:PREDICTED: uncharacterized protein LOC109207824 [Nicotiana attenuata]|uniref:Uncharacterized protein n=1 Tax=Nicotiana attenuata TaxID=49451 RepID=A0A314KS39_NICAT|nr:PREDICTED: uncharacterized protein LOC109207824 [Nicotiana attenuata]OIT32093.1 hypothetical protein A4A49_09108 [Nicotiana attenuata]